MKMLGHLRAWPFSACRFFSLRVSGRAGYPLPPESGIDAPRSDLADKFISPWQRQRIAQALQADAPLTQEGRCNLDSPEGRRALADALRRLLGQRTF